MKPLWYIALAVLAFKICVFWGLLKFTGNFLMAAGTMLAIKLLVIPGVVLLFMWFKGVFKQGGARAIKAQSKSEFKSKSLSGKRAG